MAKGQLILKAYGALALALVVGGAASTASAESIDRVLKVEDVQQGDDMVRGRIVNETGDELENVGLLVTDQFLWRNERHPGADSPSDAHKLTVPGPVPPHGSVTFEFRRPTPLAHRSDGEFHTDVVATEVTRRPPTTARTYDSYETRTYEGRSENYHRSFYDYDR